MNTLGNSCPCCCFCYCCFIIVVIVVMGWGRTFSMFYIAHIANKTVKHATLYVCSVQNIHLSCNAVTYKQTNVCIIINRLKNAKAIYFQ